MCCRKGSVIVDFELHYAGSISVETKESIHTALETASGLKSLGAEFKVISFTGTFLASFW